MASGFQLRFELRCALLFGSFMLFVGIERRRVTGYVESIGAVEIGGAEGDRGGILDLDIELSRRREDAVVTGSVG